MRARHKHWFIALAALLVSACGEDTPDDGAICAPFCDRPVQMGGGEGALADAGANPANPPGSVSTLPTRPSDAAVVVGSDAGRLQRDAGSSPDAGPSAMLTDAGLPTTNEAGASEAGAGEARSECQGPKARSGEPCALDADCGAGLLCEASTHICRAISGIQLVSSFSPSGRTDGYSEGLDFAHGSLWQSTAMTIWRIDVSSRAVVASYPVPSPYGEGLTWRGDVLYNASYRNSNLYAATLMEDRLSFQVIGQLQMTGGCAYGIVDHCDELYTTRCGRSVVDVYASGTTAPILRTFTINDTRGTPLPEVEDLEIYRGQLWTSTFNSRDYDSTLFRVDLETHRAVAAYEIPCTTLAIDGVAADPATRTLYVTGKDCPIFVYRVE